MSPSGIAAVLSSSMYWSLEKEDKREMLFAAHPHPHSLLTLPGIEVVDARKFLRNHGTRIDCVERNDEVYVKQLELLSHIPHVRLYNCSFLYYTKQIQPCQQPFDVNYLDFHMVYGKPLEEHLTAFFTNQLSTGAVIGITVAKAHDHYERLKGTLCLDSTCCGLAHEETDYQYYKDNREKVIAATISAIAQTAGHDISWLNDGSVSYTNTDSATGRKGITMMFFLFKVVA